MKIINISFGGGKVKINYLAGENDKEENMLASQDLPTPEFIKALKGIMPLFAQHFALPDDVIKNCELKKLKFKFYDYLKDKDVYVYRMFASFWYSPSFTADGVITGECIEIPAQYDKEKDKFTVEAKKAGDEIQEQALKYINGERAQTKLDYNS